MAVAAPLAAATSSRTEIVMGAGLRLILTVDRRRCLSVSLHAIRGLRSTRLAYGGTTETYQPIALSEDALWVDGAAFDLLNKRTAIRDFLIAQGVQFKDGAP